MRRQILRRAALAALIALGAACGGAPDTPDAAAGAIAARIAAADLAGADEQLRAAILKWPQESRLRELQGDLDLERGYGTRAQAAYERALRGAPGDRRLQLKLARSLLVQNRLREVLLRAAPELADPDDVRAGFLLLRLEAELAGRTAEFRASREAAENLWRMSAGAATPVMADTRRRLERLAPRWDEVEAGRQHAQCRPPAEPAPTAESDVATGTVIRVGPGEALRTPGAAAAVAGDGAVIEIAVGDYDEGEVTWTQDNLTLRGRKGRPRLRAPAGAAAGAIWVLKGQRTVIENVELAGAGDRPDGAGIRLEGAHLTVRGSVFRGNGTGIVATAEAPDSEILVTGSEFAGDVALAGASLDVGRVGRLTVEFSHIHGERSGQHLRSRARVTVINYNRVVDAGGGAPGALLDLPDGGTVEILGNELLRGPAAGGREFIAFGAPGGGDPHGESALFVLGNSLYNEAGERAAVRVRLDAPALVANNVFAGAPLVPVAGKALEGGNHAVGEGLADPGAGDFRLRPGSPAIDAAVDAAGLRAGAPPVEFEYLHPISGIARLDVWTRDAGAHEFCGTSAAAALREDLPLLAE